LGSDALGRLSHPGRRLLFGRWTYEPFTGYWGPITDPDNPIASALNKRPKYLASTTITDPQWADTTILDGDLAAAIGALKTRSDGELQVHGSGTLARWLFKVAGTKKTTAPKPINTGSTVSDLIADQRR
jgi:dihydrofolate reductase